mgnify:CR=1 FL=1
MRKKDKLVCGVGVNDADYPICEYENGKRVMCPYYRTWKNMLERAYSDKLKEIQPTYRGVTVCEEWHSFMRFRAWMVGQGWEGRHLDKDILLQGNKVYSPSTCVFVDRVVNNFLTDCAASRGEWPLGVYWKEQSKKFVSQCNNPFSGKREHLGYFYCPHQAHLTWKKRKHELACQLADIQTDGRVAEALRTRYK